MQYKIKEMWTSLNWWISYPVHSEDESSGKSILFSYNNSSDTCEATARPCVKEKKKEPFFLAKDQRVSMQSYDSCEDTCLLCIACISAYRYDRTKVQTFSSTLFCGTSHSRQVFIILKDHSVVLQEVLLAYDHCFIPSISQKTVLIHSRCFEDYEERKRTCLYQYEKIKILYINEISTWYKGIITVFWAKITLM